MDINKSSVRVSLSFDKKTSILMDEMYVVVLH